MSITHQHIVRSLDEEQQRLLSEILRMGEMAVTQLEAALDVIDKRDDQAAARIIGNDDAIDALEQEISHDVMRLALRGPLARDLREILAALRISSDIERIGDYAANLAKRSRARDAELDTLHTSLFRELLTYMMEDARAITPCTHLLFMAKNLERIGDHATNIAENVWFLVHGEEQLPPREKRDATNSA